MKKIRLDQIMLLAGTLSILAAACRPIPKEAASRRDASNLSFIYNPVGTSLHPIVSVYHMSDSISSFYIGFSAQELLFNQANVTGDFLTQLKIRFELNELEKSGGKQFVDSGTYIYNLKKDQLKNVFLTSIPFHAYAGRQYMLRIYIYDMVRLKSNQCFVMVDKSNPFNEQNFLVHGGNKGEPFLVHTLNTDQSFSINYRNEKYSRIYISYYNARQPLPLPIYATEMQANLLSYPDSSWSSPLNDTVRFNLPKEGIYMFRVDTMVNSGLPMYNFGSYYPSVKTVDDMAGPLAFLSNTKEYQEINAVSNKKLAMDKFWVSCTKNMDQARELIRIYYNRVFFANYYFTADREGWKTDRGMIFIVYGPPNTLYKSEDEEKWLFYKKPGHSIVFTFRHIDSKWSNNLFTLVRGQELDTHWRQAVESWRSGKVFLLE